MKQVSICFFISSVLIAIAFSGCSDINSSTPSEAADGIKSVIPARAPFGARIVIAGKGFEDVQQILFNGAEARINAASDSVLLTQVPLNATSGPIEVVTDKETFTGPSFTVDSTDNLFLAIHAVRPTRVRVEDTVRISGTGFTTTIAQPNASQHRDLSTSSENESLLAGKNITAPDMGNAFDAHTAQPVKSKMRIKAAQPKVFFNDISASIISASDTSILATVPQDAETGLISVIVEADTVIGPRITVFRHLITEISPTSGLAGTKVTINGQDFSEVPSQNIITFNGTPAAVLSASKNQLQTEVPEGASSGKVAVQINNTLVQGPAFTVLASTGTLLANITTSGADLDTDGYLISVDEGEGERVQPNDAFKRMGLSVGSHQVGISDIASNCFVSEDVSNPRAVDIAAGETTTIQYTVVCEGANEPPVAIFTYICTNLSCDFDASGSTDSDGSIVKYEWIFGDGAKGTGKTLSHSYETADAYTVQLTITDNEGGTDLITKQVAPNAPNVPPVARFTFACTNLSCDFDASGSTDSDGTIVSYNWVFGNMGNGTGKTASSSFEVPGTYTVKLTVTDDGGATNEISKDVTVSVPKITGISPTSGFVGTEVTITGGGFSTTKSENKVSFTSGNSTVPAQVKSALENELVVIVPSDATTGPIHVVVHGYTVLSPDFTVQIPGTLVVRTHTTGANLDPNGYLLNIQGVDERTVQVNDTVTYNELMADNYTLGISDVAANCYVSEQFPNPRTVAVTEGGNTVANFDVYCEAPNEPPVASFTYACANLSCDFDASGSTDSDGTIMSYNWVFGNMGNGTGKTPSRSFEIPGTYNVRLIVTDDEGAADTLSKEVTVTLPKITSISPTEGPTGTTVTIKGSNFGAEASENVVTFNGVTAQLNSVSETEIEAVVPANATTGPVKVAVHGYRVSGPTFTVQEAKTLEVTIKTVGTHLDADGYTVSVVGQTDQNVQINDDVTYNNIYDNQAVVKLNGVADNCRVEGSIQRTVDLNNSDRWGSTTYNVDCTIDIRGQILYTTNRNGSYDIYRESKDGSKVTQITKASKTNELAPALSPDGLSIAFVVGNNIFIMDSDGSNIRQVTQSGYNYAPSWSPKGDKLIFQGNSEVTDIYIINTDGTGLQNLTNTVSASEKSPSWSADDLIVYSSNIGGNSQLYIMKPDGSGKIPVIANGSYQDTQPEWSPDGTKIAFVRYTKDGVNKVFIVQRDGTGAYELSWGSSEESSPSWSPDGSMMTYAAKDGTSYNIVVFTVDYQDILHVSYNSSDDKMPHWNYGSTTKLNVVGE